MAVKGDNRDRIKVSAAPENFWHWVDIKGEDDCWLWTRATAKGYGYVYHPKYKRPRVASRIAYELTYGDIPEGMDVCHKCDNPPCCNPKHLFLGTRKDNVQDMMSKGRGYRPKPEECARTKLTRMQVEEIRHIKSERKISNDKLGAMFNISGAQVSRIVHHLRWA